MKSDDVGLCPSCGWSGRIGTATTDGDGFCCPVCDEEVHAHNNEMSVSEMDVQMLLEHTETKVDSLEQRLWNAATLLEDDGAVEAVDEVVQQMWELQQTIELAKNEINSL